MVPRLSSRRGDTVTFAATLVLLACSVPVALTPAVLPYEAWMLGYAAVTMGAAAIAVVGARRTRRRPACALAAALVILSVGDLIWGLDNLDGLVNEPSSVDVFYLVGVVMLAGSIFFEVGGTGSRRWDADALLDVATTVVVVGMLLWFAIDRQGQAWAPGFYGVTTVVYPVVDAILISLVIRLVITGAVAGARGFALTAGVVCYLFADLGYLFAFTPGEYDDAGALLGWMVGVVLMAQWPHAVGTPVQTTVKPSRRLVGRVSIAVLPLAVPSAVVLLRQDQNNGSLDAWLFPSVAVVVLVAIAIARMVRLLRSESRLIAELEHQRSLSAAQAQIVATVAHEIRTPMTGVLGYTELLLTSDLSAEQQKLASRANRAGRALVSTVNGILDLARFEADAAPTAAEPFPVRTLVGDVVDLAARASLADTVDLKVQYESDVPQVVSADPGLVRQVLLNLVGNAAKFTERGFVEVAVSVENTTRPFLVFRVRDTGVGIPASELERIFEPFAQATGAPSQRRVGTGLGLSISRSLVRRLNGELSVESTLGLGSVFTFRLPFQPANPDPRLADDAGASGRLSTQRPTRRL